MVEVAKKARNVWNEMSSVLSFDQNPRRGLMVLAVMALVVVALLVVGARSLQSGNPGCTAILSVQEIRMHSRSGWPDRKRALLQPDRKSPDAELVHSLCRRREAQRLGLLDFPAGSTQKHLHRKRLFNQRQSLPLRRALTSITNPPAGTESLLR